MASVVHANRIISTETKIEVDNIEHYSGDTKHIGDFSDPNDIPNIQTVQEIADNAAGSTLLPAIVLEFTIGSDLPIPISDFQTDYSAYGQYPDIMVFYTDTGIEIKTASITRSPLESPTDVTIDAANDGTNHTDGNLTIVIKQ